MPEEIERERMRLALSLAEKGRGEVSPNPLVGAVIVNKDEIVGEGFHDGVGRPHAEIHALSQAGERARGATMYVTLEPCSTWGRTPPCTDAIVKAGISKVFVATTDPNPSVKGNGIRLLRESGIEVSVGLLSEEAEKQNEYYLHFMTTGLPFVVLKIAATIDGKIAARDGESKWITGAESRQQVQTLRNGVDAILVGIGTVIKDNPSLTVRSALTGERPKRIVLDSSLRIRKDAAVLDESAPTIIATNAQPERPLGSAQVWSLEADDSGMVNLDRLLERAAEEEITSILVEGGAGVFSSFLSQGKVDKVIFFLSPRILGSGIDAFNGITGRRLDQAYTLQVDLVHIVGDDIYVVTYPSRRGSSDRV